MSEDVRITRIEWGTLEAGRPRHAGSNARLGDHGERIRLPLVRLTDSDGATGFGRAHPDRLQALLGQPLQALHSPQEGIADPWLSVEFPLWDLLGQRAGKPVYALVGDGKPLAVPCYDTSLYFDDLHLTDTAAAAELLASEARAGHGRGHRAFKLKVGRGARHLPLEEGTARDVSVIRAVRAAVGPDCPLLIDANNGYNLNLTKRVLDETAEAGIFWLEEAFHEDPVLYRDLKEWMAARGLKTLIADGEGEASPSLLRWAQEGLVDVIQYDIFGHGLTRWLRTGQQLDEWGVRSAPHHYGAHFGNFATCHLAPALKGFTFVEWDEASAPGLDTSGYRVVDGQVHVPALPGFGLNLDEAAFAAAIQSGGGVLS